jgi:hypothetical protein
MGVALKFLERYHQEGNNFLYQIVTEDETWFSHIIPESKHQSLEWHHSHSLSKPQKFKRVVNPESLSHSSFGTSGIHARRPNILLADFAWDVFFSILPTVRTWLQVIFTCSHTLSSFWVAHAWVAIKKRRRSMDWQQISTMQAYRNSSHNMSA